VFYEKARVFDYQEAGGAGFFCGGGVGDSLLEPERFGVDGDGGIGDRRNVFGAAENIDNVDGARGVFETGIGFFAEDLGFVGVDGDDFVPGGLEVGSDFVGRARGVGGEAHYGDGFGGAHKVANCIGGGGGVVWKIDEHLRWMWEEGKRINGIRGDGKWKIEEFDPKRGKSSPQRKQREPRRTQREPEERSRR
jgi:hypothetical protein